MNLYIVIVATSEVLVDNMTVRVRRCDNAMVWNLVYLF